MREWGNEYLHVVWYRDDQEEEEEEEENFQNMKQYIYSYPQTVLSELISMVTQYLPVAGIETRLNETPSQSL